MKINLRKIFLGRFEEKKNLKLIVCAIISLFYVMFVWNFWTRGVYALGMNYSFFLLMILGLFSWELHEQKRLTRDNAIWFVPILLIIFSFFIYDNPFLKTVNLLVLPVIFVVFYNYAVLENKNSRYWDISFFRKIIKRFFSFFSKLGGVITSYTELLIPANKEKREVIAKVVLGVVLLVAISLTVFIPLLSSADTVFEGKMKVIYDYIKNIVEISTMFKIVFFVIFSIVMSSMLFAWSKTFDYKEEAEDETKIDSIITGIVLGGVFLIYLLFLWVQIERLWVGALPFDFRDVVSLVKSGFWQLFFLSIINIVIYFFTYRKTSAFVQWILAAFTMASFLLLSSAGYRMVLYVKYYGFSYEKFFASYTVIYCIILFIWLITRLFINKRSNIIKFLIVLFIWMYAVVTVFPVEQFILRTNVALSKLEKSRIDLFELTMLSPDVLSFVKSNNIDSLSKNSKPEEKFVWGRWPNKKDKIVKDKKWYERNLMNIRYLNSD